MNPARFEVVATDAGYLARYIATAGRHSYTFETPRPFPLERRALVAIFAFTGHTVQATNGYPPEWDRMVQGPKRLLEVRDVDERTPNLVHGSHAGRNRGCPCALCREFSAAYRGSGLPDGEAS